MHKYPLSVFAALLSFALTPTGASANDLLGQLPSVSYVCEESAPGQGFTVHFLKREPQGLIASHAGRTVLMFPQPAASGSRYEGRDTLFWEHHGEATIRWGEDAVEQRCWPDQPPSALAGTHWALLALHSMDDAQGTTKVDDPKRYTLAFGSDGRVALRLDCNRAMGHWQGKAHGEEEGSLRFGQLAMTRAACPPGSLDTRVAMQLDYVRSYILRDGKLYLSLMADGGIQEWHRQ